MMRLDAHAGRRIPWSSNNYNGAMEFPYDLFDCGTAGMPHGSSKPHEFYEKITKAAKPGRQQIHTGVSTGVARTRRILVKFLEPYAGVGWIP